jgi:hypothetical protein
MAVASTQLIHNNSRNSISQLVKCHKSRDGNILSALYVKLPLFQLRLLIFLVNYSKHLLYHLVAAIMTLTVAHFGVVRTIQYCLDETIAGLMLILNAFIRIGHNIKCCQPVKYVPVITLKCY